MQCSVLNYSEIDLGDRIDAEYFQPTFLHIEEKLVENQARPLRDFCSITGSAFYPAATHLYDIGNLPFIRCVDCISYPLITSRQNSLFEKIPIEFADEHRNVKRLSRGDIVITKVRTPCFASIIHDLEDVALSRTVLGLKSITNIDSYYLVAFLRSKYGFLQLFRERELTIQFQLTLDRVGRVLVFKPVLNDLEDRISACLRLQEVVARQAEDQYSRAQTILLSELSLANWQPQHRLTFVRNYSDTRRAGRIDAEHFQPKYEDMLDAVEEYPGGWDTLGCLVYVKDRNYKPEDETEYRYIELADIGDNGEITGCMVEEGQDLPSRARRKVAVGDVIVSSIEGSLNRIALIGQEYDQALCSTGFHVLNSKSLNSETLLVLMKSVVGQLQLKKGCSGTILTAIGRDELDKLSLPIIPSEKQAHIKQSVFESFSLREQSKHLLECAKRAVEIAIEEDEQTAINWLKSETDSLQIDASDAKFTCRNDTD